MTYAWAILIISIVLIVVWQLGILEFGGNIQPGSTGFWGVTVEDFKITNTGELTISCANYIGAILTINTVVANQSTFNQVTTPARSLAPGALENIVVSGLKPGKGGSRFEILLMINYTDTRTGNDHLSSGRIWGSYED